MVWDSNMGPDTEIKRHRIIVIQSLQSPYKETGRDLYDDILRYKEYLNNDCFSEFYSVENKQEFVDTIKSITDSLIDGDVITLHFETHGSERGVSLNSNEILSWEEFDDVVRPINVKTCNLLVISMAMCFGGALLSHIDPEQRAPYLCFIGSHREVSEEEIIEGYHKLYENYTSPLDIYKAFSSLTSIYTERPDTNPFGLFCQDFIFDATFDPDRDPNNFKSIVEQKCFQKYGNTNIENIKHTESNLRLFYSNIIKTFRYNFLFKDVYNNNKVL